MWDEAFWGERQEASPSFSLGPLGQGVWRQLSCRVLKRALSLIFLEDSPTASGMRATGWSLPLQMASTPVMKQTVERECPWLVAAKVHWGLFVHASVSQSHGHLMVYSPSKHCSATTSNHKGHPGWEIILRETEEM